MPVALSRTSSGTNWQRIFNEWARFIPFLLIFLVHNFLLFPRFYLTKKRFLYLGTTFLSLLAVSLLWIWGGKMLHHPAEMLPLNGPGFSPVRPPAPPGLKPWFLNLLEIFIVSTLVVGFNATIKLTVKGQAEEQKNKELEKQKLETELAFLKNQISPHFFMNTLNNIHALIDINAEDAKESIIKLSKLMRYLLYDSEQGKTTLAKEIEFIKSYVDLMKLRFTEQVSVVLSFPESLPNFDIPPMLFTSLVENAFKHGVSYQSKSYIEIFMNSNHEFLFFRVKNSKQNSDDGLDEKRGIGLENLRKRLDLIYGKRYSIDQNENGKVFEINIKLPLNED